MKKQKLHFIQKFDDFHVSMAKTLSKDFLTRTKFLLCGRSVCCHNISAHFKITRQKTTEILSFEHKF